MKSIAKFGLILGLAALSVAFISRDASASTINGAYCREFTKTVVIDRKQTQAWGTACLQPDGAWQIVDTNTDAVYDYPDRQIVLHQVVPAPPQYNRVVYYSHPVTTTRYVYVKQPVYYSKSYHNNHQGWHDRGWDRDRHSKWDNRGRDNNRHR